MAHIIKDHPVCGIEHGHSYHLNVYLNGHSEKWVDFHDIKQVVESEISSKYDHKKDKTGKVFEISAEELAMNIGQYLQKAGYGGYLELFETEKYGVRYDF